MSLVEHSKFLMRQIEEKNEEILKLREEIERLQTIEQAYEALKKTI